MSGLKALNGLLEDASKKLATEDENTDMEAIKDAVKDAVPDFAREITLSVQRWASAAGMELDAEDLTKTTFWVCGLLKGKASELHRAAKLVARKGDALNRQLKRSIESTEYPVAEEEEFGDTATGDVDAGFADFVPEQEVTDDLMMMILASMAASYRLDSASPADDGDSMALWDEDQIADSMEFVARGMLAQKSRFKAIAKLMKRNPKRFALQAVMTLKGGI